VRLGLFGGTFDPPHIGHLLVASDACESLGLDQVVFIPTFQQPLKEGRSAAPPEARRRMVEVMVASDPRFAVDAAEIDRGGLSYTVDTLQSYAVRHPDAERFFMIGADAVQSFESWREPGQIVRLARLAIMARPNAGGGGMDLTALRERVRALGGPSALEPAVVPTRQIDVSSTEIRERVREGKPIRGFVVEAVARYIEMSGLYHQ
jgi:nicotinate-nucleotide adenylyltransferase